RAVHPHRSAVSDGDQAQPVGRAADDAARGAHGAHSDTSMVECNSLSRDTTAGLDGLGDTAKDAETPGHTDDGTYLLTRPSRYLVGGPYDGRAADSGGGQVGFPILTEGSNV